MRVLAVDPSILDLGIVVINDLNDRLNIMDTRHVNFKPSTKKNLKTVKKPMLQRFKEYSDVVLEYIDKYTPDYICIEMPFVRVSQRSLILLVKFIGYLLKCFMLKVDEAHIIEIDPQEVKGFITGNRRGSKEEIRDLMGKYFRVDMSELTLDQSDAIAIAYTCYFTKINS
jgi:Holliday junction resolvasome RuvABC endonuclease subunit